MMIRRETTVKKGKREKGVLRIVAGLILLVSTLALCSCGTDDIDISGYQDEKITITGVVDQDITLTVADLKAMECITKKTESTSDKIGKVRATGPTMETVLSQYGLSQKEFDSIRIYASDDYDIKLSRDFLEKNDKIILAFGIDGKPLDSESAPVRIIIPKSDSAYWIRMVNRIELCSK